MADFLDVVVKDVELYETGCGAVTSEPVPTVNAGADSTIDSLTVWSQTHVDSQDPADKCSFSKSDHSVYDAQVETPLPNDTGDNATWTGSQIDRALQEAHFVNSRITAQKLPWETGVFATIFEPIWW